MWETILTTILTTVIISVIVHYVFNYLYSKFNLWLADRLYDFLSGTTWRSYKECVKLGVYETPTAIVILAYYELGELEVRVADHTKESEECFKVIEEILTEAGVDLGDSSVPTVKEAMFKLFESNFFQFDTVDMFEYRITEPYDSGRKVINQPWFRIFTPAPAPANA